MIKLDTVRTGILSGDPHAWALARQVLQNPRTTDYKRGIVQALLDEHAEPGVTPDPAPVAAPAPAPAATIESLLAGAGLAPEIVSALLSVVNVAGVVPATAPAVAEVAVGTSTDELSEEDAGDLVIEDDSQVKAMRREARRRTVEQYEERVLRLSRPVGFSQYMRGSVGREAYEENLRAIAREAIDAG